MSGQAAASSSVPFVDVAIFAHRKEGAEMKDGMEREERKCREKEKERKEGSSAIFSSAFLYHISMYLISALFNQRFSSPRGKFRGSRKD